MNENEKAEQIAALIRERKGYEIRGLADRVASVDAALREIGAEGATPAKRSAKRPAGKAAETR
jgi:hypothetical protein